MTRPAENVCEHGDHPAPAGKRFCSYACEACEHDMASDAGCSGRCERAPRRIQRSRAKGSSLPDGAVSVTRPGRWGNPFKMLDPKDVRERERVVAQYEMWLTSTIDGQATAAAARDELRGRDLACWCPLPAPGKPDLCHAAILLRAANEDLI